MTPTLKLKVPVAGKRFVFAGDLRRSLPFLEAEGPELVTLYGGVVVESVQDAPDYLVVGEKRKKGKAATERAAKPLLESGQLTQLDETGFLDLFEPDLQGQYFAFAGDFRQGPFAMVTPASMAEKVGGIVLDKVDERIDYLVVADRRAKGKAAVLRDAEEVAKSKSFATLNEEGFLALLEVQLQDDDSDMDFATYINQLRRHIDPRRIDRALKMLKAESFQLFNEVHKDRVRGIVQSQSGYSDHYACWLEQDGCYNCTSGGEDPCMGLQGKVCKHITLLLLGLGRTGELDRREALKWVAAAAKEAPYGEEDHTAEIYLRYKGMSAGEVDWRPTETVPEDFLAF